MGALFKYNVSLSLTLTRNEPAGISTCSRSEALRAFCAASPCLTTAPGQALPADVEGLRQRVLIARHQTPGAVAPGSNANLSDHKGLPSLIGEP